MLTDYGIDNAGAKIEDKERDIAKIETPFIAHFGGDFVVVHDVEPDNVSFFWRSNNLVVTVSEFTEAWSGVVLLAEPSEKSIEPDYDKHRKTERISFSKKASLISACILVLSLIYIDKQLYINMEITLLLLIHLCGVYISWLLLLKQMRMQSQYADKICSLFKQKECNNVLESKAAKLWGIFSWSEIGLAYFVTNVLLLLFSTNSILMLSLLSLLNIAALPYTIWSVWYQKIKARQWCVLCLIVQVLLWAIFIINFIFGFIGFPEIGDLTNFSISTALIASCLLSLILGLNALAPKLNSERIIGNLRQNLNSLKTDEDVFAAILKKQPYYETTLHKTPNPKSVIQLFNYSAIHFGNPDSPLKLTVLTNPYCNPCAMMHKRIEKLLQKTNNNISVQYILSSFSEELSTTNKYLIAACMEKDSDPGRVFAD
jgi:thiol-disulfide isomerase/thioredoxin